MKELATSIWKRINYTEQPLWPSGGFNSTKCNEKFGLWKQAAWVWMLAVPRNSDWNILYLFLHLNSEENKITCFTHSTF